MQDESSELPAHPVPPDSSAAWQRTVAAAGAGRQDPLPSLAGTDPLALESQALELFPAPMAVIAADGTLVAANRLFSRDRGLQSEDGSAVALPLRSAVDQAIARGQKSICAVAGAEQESIFELIALPLSNPPLRWLLLATEATVEINLRNALIGSRARYMDIVTLCGDSAWETGADACLTFVTETGLCGYSARQLIGLDPASLLDPTRPAPTVLPFTTPSALGAIDLWLRQADGHSLCYETSAVPLYDSQGNWCGARGICRDVTVERRNRSFLAEYRANERLLSRITEIFRHETKPEQMLNAAADACVQGLAAAGCQIFGITQREGGQAFSLAPLAVVGQCGADPASDDWQQPPLDDDAGRQAQTLIWSHDHWSVLRARTMYAGRLIGAIYLWRKPTQPAWTSAEANLIESLTGHLAQAMEQRADYLRLKTEARTDSLTGILNRRAFDEELQGRFNKLSREQRRASLLYIDLDNFKSVNDLRGHATGDAALRHVSDILRSNTRSSDLLARLGGDEFVVWLEDVNEKEAIKRAKTFLAAATALAVYSANSSKPLTMSIGVAAYDPAQAEPLAALIKRADAAMYQAKQAGKGNFALATPLEPRR